LNYRRLFKEEDDSGLEEEEMEEMEKGEEEVGEMGKIADNIQKSVDRPVFEEAGTQA